MLSAFNSQKFRFWSFISMALLVFVHGYNLNQGYLQPWTIPGEPLLSKVPPGASVLAEDFALFENR